MKLHLTSEAVVQDLFIYYFCIIPWRQPHVFFAVALAFEFFEIRIWIGIDNAQSDVVTLSQKGGFWVDFLLRNQYAIPTCCDCVFGCKIPFAHARAVSLLLRVARLTLRVRLLLVFSYPFLLLPRVLRLLPPPVLLRKLCMGSSLEMSPNLTNSKCILLNCFNGVLVLVPFLTKDCLPHFSGTGSWYFGLNFRSRKSSFKEQSFCRPSLILCHVHDISVESSFLGWY